MYNKNLEHQTRKWNLAEPNKSYDLDSVKEMMWRDDKCLKLQCVDLERVERQGHCSFVDSCTFVDL